MRVLIAEDDIVTRKLLTKSLEAMGYRCDVFTDGYSAWEAISKLKYSVLLLDWTLPGLSSESLCQRVRERDKETYTYIIALTNKIDPTGGNEALGAGADDSLYKPLNLDAFATRIAVARRIMAMQQKLEMQREQLLLSQRQLELSNEVLEEQREANAELLTRAERLAKMAEASNRRFEQLFKGLPVAGFTFDKSTTIFEWNTRAEITFEITADRAIGRPLAHLLGKKLINKKALQQINGVFEGVQFTDVEWKADGKVFRACGQPLHGASGEVLGCLATAVDITELRNAQALLKEQNKQLKCAKLATEEANARLAELAVTDALTRIPNHRALNDRLRIALHDAERGQKVCLAMVDVDFFKNFNDEFGHQAGDEVLIAVADALKQGIRKTDFVARYGGEEFCVLFSGASEATAVKLADRLREKIAAIVTPYRRITASFGVSAHPGVPVTGDQLIKAADSALYDAKAAGRNTVRTRKVELKEAA